MASYRVEWKRSAAKELKNLPQPVILRILDSVGGLAENPYPHGSRKLAGSGHSYRIRVGDYRVLYTIEDDILLVQIIRVGHRRDVYR
ncbi:MAG: type II toxin-antitoxin system RelE/ParE family toxin [Chloroflexota bacterium]|jgi:mRNA interferase RelE/StbE